MWHWMIKQGQKPSKISIDSNCAHWLYKGMNIMFLVTVLHRRTSFPLLSLATN